MEIVQNRWANSGIEHHQCWSLVPNLLSKLNVTARHWIVLSKEDGGGVCVCVWWGGGVMRD